MLFGAHGSCFGPRWTGPKDSPQRPALAGKTVIPGLIDVRWHGSMGSEGILPQRSWINAASLAFGVTTPHDPSNDTPMVFAASELARAGPPAQCPVEG